MSERFIRCTQCGYPHVATAVTCPVTRKPIRAAPEPKPKPNAWAEPVRRPPLSSGSPTEIAGTSKDDEFIGQVIGGKYQIRGFLGHGGMGTVFEAVHIGIGRPTAIKVLHTSQLRKRDAVRRFHQEAKAAARIGHPNICEVYDLGTLEDGRPYLVMERLVGETVADAIARDTGGIPFVDAVDILKQVLSGLYAAHEKGIIHRDIKPENVFLSMRVGCPPVVKLLDFGVSKMMTRHPQSKDDGDFELTRTGIVLGTPYYLAPEQARGDRNLDARVDLYACGVLLYEALTGRRPFVAPNYNALLIQILTGAPRPIRELRKDIPDDLVRIVEKAMARERHQRYGTAIDFQSDLPQLEVRAPPPSRAPPPLPPPIPRPSSRPAAPEPLLRATRLGAPIPASRDDRPAAAAPPPPSSRAPRAMLDALPVATLFLPNASGQRAAPPLPYAAAAPDAGAPRAAPPRPAPRVERPPLAPPRERLSSSEEIDALIDFETPQASPARPGRVRRKIHQGFEEQPTEVNLPRMLDDESTAQLHPDDARRITEHASRAREPGATTRIPTLLPRRGIEFVDDGETDVMTADLRSRMHDLGRRPGSAPRGSPPDAPTNPARGRKR